MPWRQKSVPLKDGREHVANCDLVEYHKKIQRFGTTIDRNKRKHGTSCSHTRSSLQDDAIAAI